MHPEELQKSYNHQGIQISRQRYIPKKTLVSTSRYTSDTYENRMIKLNFNGEFEMDENSTLKDNPEYTKDNKEKLPDEYYKELDVYDVLLAGVEING